MKAISHVSKLPIWNRVSTRTLFFTLSAALIFVFVLYVYLVNKTIMNVVARERTERAISSLSGKIGELEFKYITLRNGVTLDLARSKGFTESSPSVFIARKGETTLSYNYSR